MNVQEEMDKLIAEPDTRGKTLLLQACCAPCSSYVLTYLRSTFRITVLYFNPNITAEEEYRKRAKEEQRFIDALNAELEAGQARAQDENGEGDAGEQPFPINYIDGRYAPSEFLEAVKGYEDCPEGGDRCAICFRMRLAETAKLAAEGGYNYFATTLTLSPLKNAELINVIGAEEGAKYGANYLPSNFKKKNGNKRSIELSKEYGLYRQDYCGCSFSKAERERQKAERL